MAMHATKNGYSGKAGSSMTILDSLLLVLTYAGWHEFNDPYIAIRLQLLPHSRAQVPFAEIRGAACLV